jgi:hypothetical protein
MTVTVTTIRLMGFQYDVKQRERERERERESEREREYVCVREIRAPHQLLGLSKNATLDDLAPDFVNQCRGNALIH